MKIKEAIAKAVDGGYPIEEGRKRQGTVYDNKKAEILPNCENSVLLDPLFWKSLGKAMGWGSQEYHEHNKSKYNSEWQYRWVCLIDHLAEGKSIEDYFNTL